MRGSVRSGYLLLLRFYWLTSAHWVVRRVGREVNLLLSLLCRRVSVASRYAGCPFTRRRTLYEIVRKSRWITGEHFLQIGDACAQHAARVLHRQRTRVETMANLCSDVNDHSDAPSILIYILKRLVYLTLFSRIRLKFPGSPPPKD